MLGARYHQEISTKMILGNSMDHFTVSFSSGGSTIYSELEDRIEKIFTQFGYELWFAAHDPKTGLRELAFGKVKSNASLQGCQFANAAQS